MASDADVASVALQLPDNRTDFGFDDSMIETLLDSGLSVTHSILAAWRAIAGKASTMTDINESGSSRNMSIIATNARAQVTYWQTMADREDNAAGTEQIVHGISTTITRV
jgi:hypothetical protein